MWSREYITRLLFLKKPAGDSGTRRARNYGPDRLHVDIVFCSVYSGGDSTDSCGHSPGPAMADAPSQRWGDGTTRFVSGDSGQAPSGSHPRFVLAVHRRLGGQRSTIAISRLRHATWRSSEVSQHWIAVSLPLGRSVRGRGLPIATRRAWHHSSSIYK